MTGCADAAMEMLHQMQCCQLCPRLRRCAATAPAVRISTVPHLSAAEQLTSDKTMTAAGHQVRTPTCAAAQRMPLHQPPAARSCGRSHLDVDRQRSRGQPGATRLMAARVDSVESDRRWSCWHGHECRRTWLQHAALLAVCRAALGQSRQYLGSPYTVRGYCVQ